MKVFIFAIAVLAQNKQAHVLAACALLHAWPLGPSTNGQDMVTNETATSFGEEVSFEEGPSVLGYQTASFSGSSEGFADLSVPVSETFNGDYNYGFYLYLRSANGTLFHYKSNTTSEGMLNDITVELLDGDLVIDMQNYGTQQVMTKLQNNAWHHFDFSRDASFPEIRIFIDNKQCVSFPSNNDLSNVVTSFPGTLRVGKSFNADKPVLNGSLGCIQMHACRADFMKKSELYNCTSVETGTDAFTALAVSFSKTPASRLQTCRQFTKPMPDVTYADGNDVIAMMHVDDARECGLACIRVEECGSFAVSGTGQINCILGTTNPRLVFEEGFSLFIAN